MSTDELIRKYSKKFYVQFTFADKLSHGKSQKIDIAKLRVLARSIRKDEEDSKLEPHP